MSEIAVSPRERPRRPRLRFGRLERFRVRYLLGSVLLAGLYYGSAKLGFVYGFSGPVAAIVWLPVGVGIAFLYLGGIRFWPGILIGDLLANDYSTLPFGTALAQTCGNVLEVVVATWLLLWATDRVGSPVRRLSGLQWMLVAIAAGTALSAAVGALAALFGGVITAAAVPEVWRTWWLGDSLGALLVVPLALSWRAPPSIRLDRYRALEAAFLVLAVAGLSELAFRGHRPLVYLVFPALAWAALRFGERGASTAVAIAAAFTIWNTTHYYGPFVFHSIDRTILNTQLFIAVTALSTLCLAAVMSERQDLADRLRSSRARVVEAAEAERRRIQRNLHDGAQQRLLAIAVQLRLAEDEVRAGSTPDRAADLLGDVEKQLQLAYDELREFAHGIHPSLLTNLGIGAAVKSIAARCVVPVELGELPSRRFDETVEAIAYYVVAEATTNAQKYANASLIRIRVGEVDHGLKVEVADDGVGGATEQVGSGLGGLRDRVEAIGGVFGVFSRRPSGTRVSAWIPIHPISHADSAVAESCAAAVELS
jgi:signal transduction histidine kinase